MLVIRWGGREWFAVLLAVTGLFVMHGLGVCQDTGMSGASLLAGVSVHAGGNDLEAAAGAAGSGMDVAGSTRAPRAAVLAAVPIGGMGQGMLAACLVALCVAVVTGVVLTLSVIRRVGLRRRWRLTNPGLERMGPGPGSGPVLLLRLCIARI